MSQILKSLEEKLSKSSYVAGYSPSQADVSSYKEVGSAPDASTYPHASRWYRHIHSYANEHDTLPGDKAKAAVTYFPDAAGGIIAPAAAVAKEEPGEGGDDDDEIDLFGSDDEVDEEAEKLKQQRVAEYAAKKANKPKTIAKSVVTLDVKPWDDETDMEALEKSVRSIEQDGLVWGASKLVPIGYGIRKLQITLVVEDEKVSLDDLQDKIAEFEDYVQSSDVQAMQKL